MPPPALNYDVDFKLYGNQTETTLADVIPATALQSPEIVNGTSQDTTQIVAVPGMADTFSVYASVTPGTPPTPGQDVFVDVNNDDATDLKMTFVGAATGKQYSKLARKECRKAECSIPPHQISNFFDKGFGATHVLVFLWQR